MKARAAARAWLFRAETYELVERWLALLHVPRRLREDVAQQAMLGAIASFNSYDPARGPAERWFNRIVVHSAVHERDRRWNRLELVPLDQARLISPDPIPDEALMAKRARRLVHRAIALLPEDSREILKHHELHGVPLRRLARRRGRSTSGMYKRRARALALFGDRVRAITR